MLEGKAGKDSCGMFSDLRIRVVKIEWDSCLKKRRIMIRSLSCLFAWLLHSAICDLEIIRKTVSCSFMWLK